MIRTTRLTLTLVAVSAMQPAWAFCIVTNGGCQNSDGTRLLERDGHYVDPSTGESVMDVPAAPDRPVRERYVSGPLNAAEGIATPIGRAGSDESDETPQQASDRRLRDAWSPSARRQVMREEQARIDREIREAGGTVQSAPVPQYPPRVPQAVAAPPPPIVNTVTGEMLNPTGGGHYVGTRDGRLYAPAGPNGIIDTRTGQFVPTH